MLKKRKKHFHRIVRRTNIVVRFIDVIFQIKSQQRKYFETYFNDAHEIVDNDF